MAPSSVFKAPAVAYSALFGGVGSRINDVDTVKHLPYLPSHSLVVWWGTFRSRHIIGKREGQVMRYIIILASVFICFVVYPIWAQDDTTPPVLLDFTIAPKTFDTALGNVVLNFCVAANDNLSGLDHAEVEIHNLLNIPPRIRVSDSFNGNNEVCSSLSLPRFSPYDTYRVRVFLYDNVGNNIEIDEPELCDFTEGCLLENRSTDAFPDTDGDGIPDIADNCPDDANADQADADVDLLGDVCDPFPTDRDNEQAQCEADLAQCLSAGIPDADGDSEADPTDKCPDTPAGAAVDDAGCSLTQFCSAIDVTTHYGKHACLRSDWKNDEPRKLFPRDCTVNRGGRGRNDNRCVAR